MIDLGQGQPPGTCRSSREAFRRWVAVSAGSPGRAPFPLATDLAEVVRHSDEDTGRIRLFGDRWQHVGMRHRIAQGYLLVDSAIVRQTIEVDLTGIDRGARHSGRQAR